jgi:hypothetical protein
VAGGDAADVEAIDAARLADKPAATNAVPLSSTIGQSTEASAGTATPQA